MQFRRPLTPIWATGVLCMLTVLGACGRACAQTEAEPVTPLHGFDNPLIGCNDGKEAAELRLARCQRAMEYGEALSVYYAALITTGRIYRQQGAYTDAVDAFSKVLLERPLSAMSGGHMHTWMDPRQRRLLNRISYYERGLTYAAAGKYDLAKADAGSAMQAEASKAAGLKDRCFIEAVAGIDLAAALQDCDQAVAEKPEEPVFLEARGFAELKMKRAGAAIKDFDAALAKAPKLATSLYLRGLAKKQSGDAKAGESDIAAAKDIQADIAKDFAALGLSG